MELRKQKLIIIIAVAVVVVGAGVYLFLYNPLLNDLRIIRAECESVETEASRAREVIGSLKTKKTQRDLITEAGVSLAIDEMTKQGKLGGISFISMTPKKTEKSEDAQYRILPVEMQIEAAYEDLAVFLESLDELERGLVTVRSFNVVSDENNPVKLETTLVVNIYLVNK